MLAAGGNATNQPWVGAYPLVTRGRGGGIFNTGALILLYSKVYGNFTVRGNDGGYVSTACAGAGDYAGSGADGGGIYNLGGNVMVIGTTIAGNATGPGGDGHSGMPSSAIPGCVRGGNGGSAGHGGDGGGIYSNGGIVVVRESAVYGNTTGPGGAGGDGAAGSAQGGWGGDGGRGGDGAGIYYHNGTLTVINI